VADTPHGLPRHSPCSLFSGARSARGLRCVGRP
jgi:hypothetical protein